MRDNQYQRKWRCEWFEKKSWVLDSWLDFLVYLHLRAVLSTNSQNHVVQEAQILTRICRSKTFSFKRLYFQTFHRCYLVWPTVVIDLYHRSLTYFVPSASNWTTSISTKLVSGIFGNKLWITGYPKLCKRRKKYVLIVRYLSKLSVKWALSKR